jgi:hypothetical protein
VAGQEGTRVRSGTLEPVVNHSRIESSELASGVPVSACSSGSGFVPANGGVPSVPFIHFDISA